MLGEAELKSRIARFPGASRERHSEEERYTSFFYIIIKDRCSAKNYGKLVIKPR